MNNLDWLTFVREAEQQLTAPLRYGGGSGNMNICAINKHSAFRQVSASNPPQRKAAKRYGLTT